MTPLIHLEKQSDYDKIETIFNEIRLKSKPKLMTFGDVLDAPKKYWNSIATNLNIYGKGLCQFADLEPWKIDSHEENMKRKWREYKENGKRTWREHEEKIKRKWREYKENIKGM